MTVLGDALFVMAILGVLVLRFTRTRQQEERLSNELEAARTVQQVLIPSEVPAVSGLAIESVYMPASQVGGDFFQVIPFKADGVLIVIGDVSGKGMPAAMTVSLLVGTIRTLAHFIQDPGAILSAMNQRMLARSKDGFTTCMVLRVSQEGQVTVANAGHIPLYIAGKEFTVDSGLPIGLAADAEYPESCFELREMEQLTLLTDGVVEAQGRDGNLFGFERTQRISNSSAERIANAAREFGQEDDITVITLRRTSKGAETTKNLMELSSIF